MNYNNFQLITNESFQHVEYDSGLHSTQALADQLSQMCENNTNLRIAGSLGRMAFFHHFGYGDDWEYRHRAQSIASKRLGVRVVARDIDVIVSESSQIVHNGGPFPVDTTAYCGTRGRIVEQNDDWWLVADKHNFAEPLCASLMEPYPLIFMGQQFTTLQPVLHHSVLAILGNDRGRDKKVSSTRHILEEVLSEHNIRYDGNDTGAFRRLGRMNRDDVLGRCRYVYTGDMSQKTYVHDLHLSQVLFQK